MAQALNQPVGFIGLGNIGQHMARRLVDHGYSLTVYDARPEAMYPFRDTGASIKNSPAEVANECEVVLVSLPTPQVVKEVALGEHGLREGSTITTYIDLSTTGPGVAQTVASGLGKNGISALDAPVSGGVPGAKAGSLAIMASGPKDLVDQHRAMLEIIGKNVFYVGAEPGFGQTLKLINNMLSAAAFALTSEAMTLGVKAGLDPDIMLAVLNESSGLNTATRDKFPKAVVNGKFDYGFALSLMCKDVNLCMEQADQYKVTMWVGQTVKQLWNFVATRRDGNSDFTTLAQEVESWAGVKVRSSK